MCTIPFRSNQQALKTVMRLRRVFPRTKLTDPGQHIDHTTLDTQTTSVRELSKQKVVRTKVPGTN